MMALAVTVQEYQEQIDRVVNEVKEMQSLTDGSMHGESIFPSVERYERILGTLAWLRDHAGDDEDDDESEDYDPWNKHEEEYANRFN